MADFICGACDRTELFVCSVMLYVRSRVLSFVSLINPCWLDALCA